MSQAFMFSALDKEETEIVIMAMEEMKFKYIFLLNSLMLIGLGRMLLCRVEMAITSMWLIQENLIVPNNTKTSQNLLILRPM